MTGCQGRERRKSKLTVLSSPTAGCSPQRPHPTLVPSWTTLCSTSRPPREEEDLKQHPRSREDDGRTGKHGAELTLASSSPDRMSPAAHSSHELTRLPCPYLLPL